MTHYTLEAWTDFARGLLEPDVERQMRAHARQCPACAEDLRVIEHVAATVTWDASYLLGAETLSAAYRLAARLPERRPGGLRSLLARLAFDSWTEPAPAGVRTAARGVRQMVFDAERYQLHVQWEHSAPGALIALVGRISTTADPALPPGIVIRAVTPQLVAGETTTNQFGEFVLECPWNPNLALHLQLASDGVRIEVPLASASEPSTPPPSRGRNAR